MRETFQLGSTDFADVRLMNVHGQHGLGFYRLTIQVVVDMRPRVENDLVVVTDLAAEVGMSEGIGIGPLIGRMVARGSDLPIESRPHKNEQWVTFDLDMDGSRVAAIEEQRAGRDFKLGLAISGQATSQTASTPQRIRADLTIDANQSTWVKVLEAMGYCRTLLLEIPMPGQDAPEELKQTVEHLRQAQDLMMRGKHREAVGACRDVLESMGVALADEQGQTPEAVRSWFEGTHEMDKAARVRLVRRALKILTHPARHADEVSAGHEWGPEDAKAIVTATAALVQLTAQD